MTWPFPSLDSPLSWAITLFFTVQFLAAIAVPLIWVVPRWRPFLQSWFGFVLMVLGAFGWIKLLLFIPLYLPDGVADVYLVGLVVLGVVGC